MNDMQMSIRSVEQYLLVTAMSPQLQQRIAQDAGARRAGSAGIIVAFSSFSDRALVQEMESLREGAGASIARKHSFKKTVVAYVLDSGIVDAVLSIQETGREAENECARRLAKTQKVLKSQFLFDYIGSLDHEGSTAQTRSNPSFRVIITDLNDDSSTAMITMLDPEEAPAEFEMSGRTLIVLRKIVQPQPNARSVVFEFTGNRCQMKLGVTSVKDSLGVKAKRSAV